MFKTFTTWLFFLFLYIVPVRAHQYTDIDTLFDALAQDYNGVINFQEISLSGGSVLSQIDNSFKIYNSDSKAFLYQDNHLIGTFDFPTGEQPLLWKKFLFDILDTGIHRSLKISHYNKELQSEVIVKIMENLDKYSSSVSKVPTAHSTNYQIIDNILYIKPDAFYQGFSDYLKKIILSKKGIDGIILDLRDNRGGDFNEAIKTADLFLDNALIAYRENKNKDKRYYTSTAGDIFNGKPITILTNRMTASSAELVTAALVEQSRAILIGTQTYGKDSTQQIRQSQNLQLSITNGFFFTPSGKRINAVGIRPDICTGIEKSCTESLLHNSKKDILIAINVIKKNLG